MRVRPVSTSPVSRTPGRRPVVGDGGRVCLTVEGPGG